MNIKKFKEVIKRREYIENISNGEWAEGIQECYNQEIAILLEDIPSTIDYLRNECTGDEYVWISEIIDDLAVETNSRELVDCYKKLMTKFPKEWEKYSISGSARSAEEALSNEDCNEQ